jgi:hypothetical protein
VRYGDLSAADEVCDWGRADCASWLSVNRLMIERRVALNASICRTI